jgi:Tfp pilus assembly protein PilN
MTTINLLPKREKELLVQEENWKLTLVLETIFFAALICLILILFSIKTYISGQAEAQKILLSQKEIETPQMKELEEKIKTSNLLFSGLDSFYKEQPNLTGILEKLSQTIPQGTYLNDLNFVLLTGESEKLAEISLSGFSPTREALLGFKKNLEEEASFGEIYFPPFCWLKANDINFSVTFKVYK